MRKILTLLLAFFICINLFAQTKTSKPAMPDIQKLMKMTPQQQQAYAEQMKKQYSSYANEIVAGKDAMVRVADDFFGLELPAIDNQKLTYANGLPFTRNSVLEQVKRSQEALKKLLSADKINKLNSFIQSNNASDIHAASIAGFYSNDLPSSLYLSMEAVIREPDSIVSWNNLGAFLNLSGIHYRSLPILKFCAAQETGSAMILNNLGQAYLGLGDKVSAEKYLLKVLGIDSLNPEANHSMGLIFMSRGNMPEAAACFKRQLTVCEKPSTIHAIQKTGEPYSMLQLRRQKDSYDRKTRKNHIEEITLGKFSLPAFPTSLRERKSMLGDMHEYEASLSAEYFHWKSILPTREEIEIDGRSKPGPYHRVVEMMLDELNREFTPDYLSNITERQHAVIYDMMDYNSKEWAKAQCPPTPSGLTVQASQAWAIKCCEEIKRPLADKILSEHVSYVKPLIDVSITRWKSFINQMIDIVQLDPSPANKLMVYQAVAGYFGVLQNAMLHAHAGPEDLADCVDNYNPQQNDSLIASNRLWDLRCPSWLNIEVDLQVAKLKADCKKYGIEVGAAIFGQYEYDFTTGSSTIAAGVGIKAKFFADIGKAGIKQMAYITFDRNNEFSDLGIRGKVEVGISDTPINIGPVKAGGTLIGLEGSYSYGINSGFISAVKGKGILADFVKIDQSL